MLPKDPVSTLLLTGLALVMLAASALGLAYVFRGRIKSRSTPRCSHYGGGNLSYLGLPVLATGGDDANQPAAP